MYKDRQSLAGLRVPAFRIGSEPPYQSSFWHGPFGFFLLCFPLLLRWASTASHGFSSPMTSAGIWARMISSIESSYLLKKNGLAFKIK